MESSFLPLIREKSEKTCIFQNLIFLGIVKLTSFSAECSYVGGNNKLLNCISYDNELVSLPLVSGMEGTFF